MKFFFNESNRIQGVFLVDPATKPEEIQLGFRGLSHSSGFPTTDVWWDLDVWSTPHFLNLTLEHDLSYYGVEIEPGDQRVLRGVEIWYEILFSCSYDTDVTIDEFRDAFELKYYFEPASHVSVDWWIVSEVSAHASTVEELDLKFEQVSGDHRAL